jgi:hypothetical protein
MLKESGELDVLLPDLLLAMGITPLSRAMKGNRQDGVDIPAVGIDPDDGIQKLFLLTAKKGDITRNEWGKAPNGVRPSLDEIREGYLRRCIRPEHQDLPKKIILTTGGELKQNAEQHWLDYIHEHSSVHSKYGQIEFDFWGGDKLSLLIDQYLLDEYLFPESVQKHLRKTIALADQNEDEPHYFYKLIAETLFNKEELQGKTTSAASKRQKALCLLNLSLSIVFHWCREADNLKPALLCAERSVLLVWEWIRQNDLFDEEITRLKFEELFFTYFSVVVDYANKLQSHCLIQDGLFGYGEGDELEYPLRTFEVIGILGTLGIALWNLAEISGDDEIKKKYLNQIPAVAQMIAALIQNNPSASTPRYDCHSIDITLALITLTLGEHFEIAAWWVTKLSISIVRAYRIGRCFPIDTDSYNDLIAMTVGQSPPKEKLMKASVLLPVLADWFSIFNLVDTYTEFQKAVKETFTATNLMLWFPDDLTEKCLYISNAGYGSGVGLSVELYESLDAVKQRIVKLHQDNQQTYENISCLTQGWFVIGAISSRHFRTPVMPWYWYQMIREND